MNDSEKITKGRYVCAGQTPIVVTDASENPDGTHGPWIYYRMEWESDAEAKPVLWTTFRELLGIGYRREVPE